MRKVIFYGASPKKEEVPLGGGEVGNSRTVKLLKDSGYTVIAIPKYKKHPKGSYMPIFFLLVFLNYVKFCFLLVKNFKDKPVVHISGFYGNVIKHELLLIITAKTMGYEVVYELRGGGAVNFFNSYGLKYQKAFSKSLNRADHIFTQGIENISLIEQLTQDKNIFYYPNYVLDDFTPKCNHQRDMTEVKLIYFGRLAEQKNIELIIDVLHLLIIRGVKAHLTLIGQYSSDEFKQKIIHKIAHLNLDNKCVIMPSCQHEELKKHLIDKHFFIFPTNEHREGHSNALTEAMAFGIVPVASNNGFNKSVINNENLVCSEFSPKEYSERIVRILNKFVYQDISNDNFNRVQNYYTEKKIRKQLGKEYKNIFCHND